MAIVDIDFNDVPLEFPVIGAGVYVCEIDAEPEIEANKEGKGNMVKTTMTITDEGDFKGQKLFANACIWAAGGKRQLKRMALSAGVDTTNPAGIDLALFIGKSVRVQVANEMYEGKEKSKIKDFVLENNVKASTEDAQGDL